MIYIRSNYLIKLNKINFNINMTKLLGKTEDKMKYFLFTLKSKQKWLTTQRSTKPEQLLSDVIKCAVREYPLCIMYGKQNNFCGLAILCFLLASKRCHSLLIKRFNISAKLALNSFHLVYPRSNICSVYFVCITD